MNLLDTHALVWAISAPEKLSPTVRRLINEGEVCVSAASLWEMILKKGRKHEVLPDPLAWWRRYVRSSGIKTVPIDDRHIECLDALPLHHGDPFDRILVCQCISEGLRLVTRDRAIRDNYQAHISIVW